MTPINYKKIHVKIDNEQLNIAMAKYQKYLGNSNPEYFDISSLDRIGIPIQCASLRTSDGFQEDGFGYGQNAAEILLKSARCSSCEALHDIGFRPRISRKDFFGLRCFIVSCDILTRHLNYDAV